MKPIMMLALLAGGLRAVELPPRVPVLAELFTSEGCSSCPPADALLRKLDAAQPVDGVQIIVLSEHVDYWNSEGWNDPYSSVDFSQRQAVYARQLSSETFTPQIVIDGRTPLVGGNEKAILAAVSAAAKRTATPVKILSATRDGGKAVIGVEIGAGKGDVWVAVADDHDTSSVKRGENSGRTLEHVAVVRNLSKVGSTTKTAGFAKTLRVSLGSQSSAMRVVVFVAEPGGAILGSAMQELR